MIAGTVPRLVTRILFALLEPLASTLPKLTAGGAVVIEVVGTGVGVPVAVAVAVGVGPVDVAVAVGVAFVVAVAVGV
jgi:hypothetical protein